MTNEPSEVEQWQLQQVAQQRFAAQQAWLASTRGVGTLIAAGLFVLAGLRLVMMCVFFGGSMGLFEVIIRVPFIGAGLGGGLMAIGWWQVLARQPRRDQKILALIGLLVGAALAVSGVTALTSQDLLRELTSQSTAWLEVGATALALVGASMWRSGAMPASAILAWIGFALMLFSTALQSSAGFMFGLVPAATWSLAGAAVIGMRAPRPDQVAVGVPSAVLVKR